MSEVEWFPNKNKLAEEIEYLRAQLAERDALLREAEKVLGPFLNLVAKNEDGEAEDQLVGLPDGHAFDIAWRLDGNDDKSPWVSARHFRAARALHEKLKAAQNDA